MIERKYFERKREYDDIKSEESVLLVCETYPELGKFEIKTTKSDPYLGTLMWKKYPAPRHMTHISIGEYTPRDEPPPPPVRVA